MPQSAASSIKDNREAGRLTNRLTGKRTNREIERDDRQTSKLTARARQATTIKNDVTVSRGESPIDFTQRWDNSCSIFFHIAFLEKLTLSPS